MENIKDKNVYVDVKIVPKAYNRVQDVNRLIRYVMNAEKTPNGLTGARGANPWNPDQMCRDFSVVRRAYEKEYCKLARHVILSVDRQEDVQPERMLECAEIVAKKVFPEHQSIYAVHENHDAARLHVHIVVNTINYKNGLKLDFRIEDIYKMKKTANGFINDKNSDSMEQTCGIMELL